MSLEIENPRVEELGCAAAIGAPRTGEMLNRPTWKQGGALPDLARDV